MMQMASIGIHAENNGEYMYISSADEFSDLSKHCSMDSYSKGKTVVINNDIDFTGKDFSPLAYWDGMLDGGGHTISGISMKFVDGQNGFIGIVGENGTVKNLNIKADFEEKEKTNKNNASKIINKIKNDMPSATSELAERLSDGSGISGIGGIAGTNKGMITGCSFEGSIDISSETGGICGVNEESGRIESCVNRASIKSDYNTGGIVGKNYGMVKWCTNDGEINTEPNDISQNTGGICGRSYGAVEQCTNNGKVGYKSTGYNTGGITGCQNGYISECINNGFIQGRKDIGGITGQFEPYTNINFQEDELQNKVKENLNVLKDDLNDIADDISKRNESLQSRYKNFLKNIGLLPSENGIDSALDNIGSITDSAGNLSESVSNALSRMGNQGDEVVDIISEAKNAADDISYNASKLTDSVTESNNQINKLIDNTIESMNSGSEDTSKLIDQLVSSLEEMENNDDTERLINQMIDTFESLEEEGLNPSINLNAYGSSSALNRAINDLSDDVSDLLSPFLEMSDDLSDAVESARERREKIKETIQNIKDLINSLPDANPSNTANPQTTKLPVETKQPEQTNTSDQTSTQQPQKLKVKIGSALMTTAYAEDDDNKSTLEKLLDLDIRDMDIPIRRNVAGEIKDAAVIKYSINSGKVEGLNDTGGIAGCVGFDSLSKPEENINLSGEYSLNPSTAIKAVIGTCINNGEITAKNMYAGGITGYSDLGAVKESISNGKITVTEGDFAGGISGIHYNNITHCISTSDIEAKSNAGGIAGKGRDIDTCYALARIKSDGEKIGAIAGSVSGNAKYNYFLKEELEGIDGIDYNEKAQPVEKEVLASNTGKLNEKMTGFWNNDWICATGDLYMPQLRAFTENSAEGIGDILRAESADTALFRFKVKFIVDGETVKESRVDYGYVLTKDDIPELEKGDNTYGDWDKNTSEPIIRNTTFTAQYNQSTSTLSYGGEPPRLLVEGNFRPDTTLEVTQTPGDSVVEDEDFDAIEAYDFKIVENSGEYDGEVTVRVRCKGADSRIRVGCIDSGAVILTDYETDGSYLKFKIDKPGGFVILKKKQPIVLYFVIGAAVIAAAVCAVAFIRKRKKNILDGQYDEEETESGIMEDEDGGKTQE